MSEPNDAYAILLEDEAAYLEGAINQVIGGPLREERRRLGLTLQDVANRRAPPRGRATGRRSVR